MPAAVQLALAGSFVVAVPNEGEIDDKEAATARQIAEEGAAGARKRGYNASARIAQANESAANAAGAPSAPLSSVASPTHSRHTPSGRCSSPRSARRSAKLRPGAISSL